MPTLNWIGKEAVVNHHQQVPFHLLKDVPDLACGEPGDGNLIVQGDNLVALKARPRSLAQMSYQELLDGHFIIAGTPDEVADGFVRVRRELGVGHLLLEAQESRMDHPTTMRSIELMGAKVIPALAAL